MSNYSRSIARNLVRAVGLWLATAFCTLHAATITIESSPRALPSDQPGMAESLTHIRLSGVIEEGDADQLRALLARLHPSPGKPFATIELSSNGGDVYEGLKIGYLLREFDVASLVRKGDFCLSACALAFLGGTASHLPPNLLPDRRIEIGGEVGFHNFFINPSSSKLPPSADPAAGMVVGFALARGASALLVRYAGVMALDPAFISRLLGRPSEIWEYVDRDGQFVDLVSCPMEVRRPDQSDAEAATNICNHATGGFSPVEAGNARPLSARDARRRLLSLVQNNASALALKGPLVTQLNNVLAGRDDRSVEALYAELRTAGVHLPELVGPTFTVSGYVSGAYEMQCHVSFSSTDADRYDVAISGPAGLASAWRVAPDRCKRLFLFDREDMLNPTK